MERTARLTWCPPTMPRIYQRSGGPRHRAKKSLAGGMPQVPPLFEGQETFSRVARPEESAELFVAGRVPHVYVTLLPRQSNGRQPNGNPVLSSSVSWHGAAEFAEYRFPGSWAPSRGILPAHLHA